MSRSVRKRLFGVVIEAHPVVFPISATLIVTFVIITSLVPRKALMAFDWLQGEIASNFAWLYILAMSGFLVFALFLCFSRFGNIRLGPDDQRPEFHTLTWFSMLFSAGMGIGMLFFGVTEPMQHYLHPPAMQGETLESAKLAMGLTLFHWCLHPWALYALAALALAYFGFRRGLPLSFRSVFYPLIGERIHGRIGDVIDVMAVLATLFGLATSLGLGAKQVNAGLAYVFDIPQSTTIQIILIACITAMAVASLVSGLHVGIRRLSEVNMCLAGGLLLFLFVAGPTVFLLNSLVENIGTYFQRLPDNSFWTATYEESSQASWFAGWTVFYWGWWIAWCPFVGMFIARVSKGRTIREFVTGVLLAPSAVAIVWMTGFGGAGLFQEIYPEAAEDPDRIAERYNYGPREYPVQVLDEATGMPQTPDGKWLVAPDAKGVANPVGVLMKQSEDGFETKKGQAVEYQRGVLVHRGTSEPYFVVDEDRYSGEYKWKTAELTLGGYLTEPVLTDDKTGLADSTSTAMFVMLEGYPLWMITSLVGTVSVILFFVTSSDSASLVADIIASGGSEDPTTGTRIFWGVLEGCLAAVLLVAGGLKALQTGSITIGLPFCILVILMCYSLFRGLQREVQGRIPESHKEYAWTGKHQDGGDGEAAEPLTESEDREIVSY